MKKKKYSLGGQLLSTGTSLIPGIGPVLSPIVSALDQNLDQQKLEAQTRQMTFMNMNKNPLGQFAKGGIINDQFKQYSTGSHALGNDVGVDEQGNVDNTSTNTVQNNENSFNIKGKQYVFSDVLKKNGSTFNNLAMEINKKYPEARFQQDQRNALSLEMTMLAKDNDEARAKSEQKNVPKQFKLGGFPDFYSQGLEDVTYDDGQIPLNEMGIPSINAPRQSALIKPFDPLVMTPNPVVSNSITNPQPTMFNNRDSAFGSTGATTPAQISTGLSPKAANSIGLGLKGLALAGSVIDAINPAQKEQLVKPDYQQADNYIKTANINYNQARQDAVGVSNIGANMNRSSTSNFASYQGREMSRLANLSDQLGRISEGENNAQSQLNLTKGNYEQQKAVDLANRTYQNNTDNLQNQANSRLFDRVLGSDISQIGSQFNQYAESQKMIQNNKEVNQFQVNQALAILNSKYPNVKITPDIMEKLKSGASIDEILNVKI